MAGTTRAAPAAGVPQAGGAPPGAIPLPRSVAEAVRRRVSTLSDGARETLTIAAVSGRRFDFTLTYDRDLVVAERLTLEFPENFSVLFVHFAMPDAMGHQYGWLSPEQLSVSFRADEAFANLYSTAVSIQNVLPRLPHKVTIVGVAVIGAVLAALLTMTAYESFLFFIGSIFVPLFGILAADHFVIRRGTLELDDLYRPSGRYWFSGGYRVAALVPWIVGFFVFHYVNPSPLGWWMDAMAAMFGDPLSTRISWLPGSIPAFAVAFLVTLLLPRLVRLSSGSTDTNR